MMTTYLKKLSKLQAALRGVNKEIDREDKRHGTALARQAKRLAKLNRGFAALQGRSYDKI